MKQRIGRLAAAVGLALSLAVSAPVTTCADVVNTCASVASTSVVPAGASDVVTAPASLLVGAADAAGPAGSANMTTRLETLDLAAVVQATLCGNPDVLLQQREIEAKQGAIVQTRGAFEPVLRSSISHDRQIRPLSDADSQALGGRSFLPVKTTTYGVTVERLQRNGTVLRPGLSFTRTDSDMPATEPENRAEVKFEIAHPLQRGRGPGATAVKLEEAARLDLDADVAGLNATVQGALAQALQAWWSYLGTAQRLDILGAAEERARLLASQTAELIKADVTPASERSQVEANVAAKQAQRIAGEAQLRQDRRTLGLVLGLPADAIEALPVPVASFPELDAAAAIPLATVSESLLQATLALRPDLTTARLRAQAAAKRTAGSRNLEKPRVDLNVSVGYSGLDQNARLTSYVSPFSKDVRGLNAVAQVQAELPLRDLTAQGRRMQYEADEAKLRIVIDRTVRSIRSGVALAASTVVDSLRQRECAALSVAAYRQAVENEKAKLAQGMSTIIDLISLEDRLTSAMLSHIETQVALARSLVALRYETGTLALPDGTAFRVDIPSLSAVALPVAKSASVPEIVPSGTQAAPPVSADAPTRSVSPESHR